MEQSTAYVKRFLGNYQLSSKEIIFKVSNTSVKQWKAHVRYKQVKTFEKGSFQSKQSQWSLNQIPTCTVQNSR